MDKKLIRKEFHKQNYKFCKNYLVYKYLLKIINKYKIKNKKLNLLLYISKEKEINLQKYKRLLSKKFNIYCPKMLDNNSLAFTKLRLPYVNSKYKIKESMSKNENIKLDIAIIPTLGIDGDFRRIGYGKGYYDKTFSNINYNLLIIFIQNIESITKDKICSSLDLKCDFYITPKRIYKRKELK
ncbi:5-formyltetrahydrofolate cyclo-ligase [Campylobacter sp. MG1]|uniref:5-formyltetrahydrofolate cyclo-ligase n=1 Tax=Campylobacter sp. MG1 TaxID=2976332 RepID=UPI00226C7F4C|nr:5-formyltetrahydrofolate cyclo-ligase [Campylobacter sp. MG1]